MSSISTILDEIMAILDSKHHTTLGRNVAIRQLIEANKHEKNTARRESMAENPPKSPLHRRIDSGTKLAPKGPHVAAKEAAVVEAPAEVGDKLQGEDTPAPRSAPPEPLGQNTTGRPPRHT